jgi:putative phage-type endonuclease
MKVISIEQGTKEWTEFRRQHIGASDASIIMGCNPWKTKQMLWEEKVLGWEQECTEKMREGTRLESEARFNYIALTGIPVFPIVLESSEHPFLSASMDGMDFDMKKAVEIKCGASSHRLAKKGEIPEYYVAQLHHQAYITSLESIDYFSYDGKNNILIPYLIDPNYIRIMVEKELEFWHCVQSRTPPKD